jgi:glycosyltransferase involved in cell wall biosynthesis|nr:glycosyltransferase [uncultured Acetatifactor sp.]
MKKVLWLCNIVLPDFNEEFSIKKNNFGGWMTGMLHEMEKIGDIDISLCFPIRDKNRLKDSHCNGHAYYSFLCDMAAESYDIETIKTFERILDESKPEIIHIWGTEYPHTMAMLLACKNKGMIERAVINIQGLVSACAKHYLSGIPEKDRILKYPDTTSIKENMMDFLKHGKCELESIKMARHVIGRTDWDKANVKVINPQICYHFCNEILRDSFYNNTGKWKYEKCQKHSIFVSQASYPIKGFHYFVEALPAIVRQYPDVHVYVAGVDIFAQKVQNAYAHYLEKLIKRLDLSQYLSFLGNLSEEQMIQQYIKANVFVSASTVENESNSLSEARIIGVPSIASFVGGAYERVMHGIDGYLYPHDDSALLAYYVGELFDNKNNICECFSINSIKKMIKVVDCEKNAARNIAIYEEILDGCNGE